MAAMYGFNATISWGPPGEIKVWENLGRWAVKRGTSQNLNKDGSWGLGDWFASKREAEVAAVLAGMESPEVAELKKANETAQKRLAAKQAVVDQVCKERNEARAGRDGAIERANRAESEVAELQRRNDNQKESINKCYRAAGGTVGCGEILEIPDVTGRIAALANERCNYRDQVARLSAEVAKLKGELAQKSPPEYIRDIAEGRGYGYSLIEGSVASAVRKLRADYEAAKRARHYNFSRLESLAAGVAKDGETITDWAAEEIIRLRNHLNACKGIASGDVAVWIGSCAALDAVIKCRHQAVKAENARKALA